MNIPEIVELLLKKYPNIRFYTTKDVAGEDYDPDRNKEAGVELLGRFGVSAIGESTQECLMAPLPPVLREVEGYSMTLTNCGWPPASPGDLVAQMIGDATLDVGGGLVVLHLSEGKVLRFGYHVDSNIPFLDMVDPTSGSGLYNHQVLCKLL